MSGKAKDNGRKTVMVVDDEADVVTYLSAMLQDNGYRVVEARSAEEAMDKVASSCPDLVTLDVMMPRLSGLALYRKMKADPGLADVPAIFVSSFCMERDFYGDGFRKLVPEEFVPEPFAYIEKPVDGKRFMTAVKDAIGPSGESPGDG